MLGWRVLACAGLSVCASCGSPHPSAGNNIDSAFEARLSSDEERRAFVTIFDRAAHGRGMHADIGVAGRDLADISEPIKSVNVEIWQGTDSRLRAYGDPHNDDDGDAVVMDLHDDRVWIIFLKGGDLGLARRYRDRVMSEIKRRWPATVSLPLSKDGSLPWMHDPIL